MHARGTLAIIPRMDPQIESKKLVYDGAVAKVFQVSLRMPDGRVVGRDLVHYRGAAVILPVLEDGSIVLIRNYRFAVGEHLYELPAGMIDAGEDPETAAGRELIEETGYAAGRLEKLGAYCSAPGSSDEVLHAFLATDLRPGEQELEVYEQIRVEVLTEPRVREMVMNGTIHDAKTIAALALYWLRKGKA